jgi:hypothetical protein
MNNMKLNTDIGVIPDRGCPKKLLKSPQREDVKERHYIKGAGERQRNFTHK